MHPPESLLDHVLLLPSVSGAHQRHWNCDFLEVFFNVRDSHLHRLGNRTAEANLPDQNTNLVLETRIPVFLAAPAMNLVDSSI